MNYNRVSRLLAPLVILAGLGYLEFIYSFKFCYQEVYRHLGYCATGVGLIIGLNTIFVILLITWSQAIIIGPGILDRVPPYKALPDIFMCNEAGMPFWCSNCQSVKVNRSHHSSTQNACIPRFDHFCILIGCNIGERNYKNFHHVVVLYFSYFIFIFVSLTVFASRIKAYASIDGRLILDPNIVVLYIVTAFWLIMLAPFLVSQIISLKLNRTTIEDMNGKRLKRLTRRSRKRKLSSDELDLERFLQRYVNLRRSDGMRVVLKLLPSDCPYDKGFYANCAELYGSRNPLWWFIPCFASTKTVESEFSFKFKEDCNQRIAQGQGFVLSGVSGLREIV